MWVELDTTGEKQTSRDMRNAKWFNREFSSCRQESCEWIVGGGLQANYEVAKAKS